MFIGFHLLLSGSQVDNTTYETAINALDQRLPNGFFIQWLQGIVIITPPAPVEQKIKALEAKAANDASDGSTSSIDDADAIAVDATVIEPLDLSHWLVEPDPGPPPFTGTDVRKLRQAAGISQMELAIAMGMSQSWVRNLENKWLDRPIKSVYVEQLKKILTGDRKQ